MARVIRPKAFDAETLPTSGDLAEGPVMQLDADQVIKTLAIMLRYTRGAADGSVAMGLEISDGEDVWHQTGDQAEATPATGVELQDVTQRKSRLYKAEGATIESICFRVWNTLTDGPLTARGVRMTAKEVGATGSPGTITARFVVET